jgi:hypothetical protein
MRSDWTCLGVAKYGSSRLNTDRYGQNKAPDATKFLSLHHVMGPELSTNKTQYYQQEDNDCHTLLARID